MRDYETQDGFQAATLQRAVMLVSTVPDPDAYTAAVVRKTAKSVTSWVWERRLAFAGGKGRYVDPERQRWRAYRRAECLWDRNQGRDSEIVRLSLAGFSQRVIARSMDVSPRAIRRVLARLEEEAGAPVLRTTAPEPERHPAGGVDPISYNQEAEAGPESLGPQVSDGIGAVVMSPGSSPEGRVGTPGEALDQPRDGPG